MLKHSSSAVPDHGTHDRHARKIHGRAARHGGDVALGNLAVLVEGEDPLGRGRDDLERFGEGARNPDIAVQHVHDTAKVPAAVEH